MKFATITLSLLLLTGNLVFAQFTRFPVNGIIEFERKVNMHAVIRKSINKQNETFMNNAFEQYKKSQPQFKTSKSTLSFSKDKSYFLPIESTEGTSRLFSWLPSTQQINTVYNDLSTKTSIIQKKVFDETFLLKDTTRQIKWKITNETREIAGYSCRRANAIIMDSVYVVAYYTDQIPVSSGPETFSGLPGMILGVALPHDHITWFATSVTDKPLEKPIAPITKGKLTTSTDLRKTLQGLLKQYGEHVQPYIKAFML